MQSTKFFMTVRLPVENEMFSMRNSVPFLLTDFVSP